MAFVGIKKKRPAVLKPDVESWASLKPNQIGISPRAAEHLKVLLEKQEPGTLMRVGLQGGGCSGLKPYFDFEAKASDADQIFTQDGVSVCVDPRSMKLIGGSWLDFDGGFKIKSERLKRSCSCGESFAIN
ncbi:MAG: iron-sulfur cluster assembly accessory protein [Deltaproteobacteria bacterium]|nr:iron-sulfur cluster assembly accessory protein [Deltaproteobacteria bacterium]